MTPEEINLLLIEIEQLEWLLRSLFTEISNGDTISASIGIDVAIDKVTHIKGLILNNKHDMEENTNGQ